MRIAIVGSGISGLSAAWLLAPNHEVVLFEANDYAGGHSNTVDVSLDNLSHPVDTGFLVHNDRTYPNLIQLFPLLNVATHPTEMTFSVSLPAADVEWAGSDLGSLFAQTRNLWRPAFWRMLSHILRFNRDAGHLLAEAVASGETLGELLGRHGYSQEFRDWYLYPMGAAIWSSPLKGMDVFPAETFIRFCLNHGLLQIMNRPQWKTVVNGSRVYVQAMLERISNVRLSSPVSSVRRTRDAVEIESPHGCEKFDRVILACHTDQALAMLNDAHPEEHAMLSAIRYQANTAWLHTDDALMPQRQRTWSAWNYYSPEKDSANAENPVAVTYWLNRLQQLPFKSNLFLTLNPPVAPEKSRVLQKIEYAHPLLDSAAYAAQKKLALIQGMDRVYFCGAWAGYGFHEDGLKSGMKVASLLGANIPWKAHHE